MKKELTTEREIGKEIVIKQFQSTKELYHWLRITDMDELKAEIKEKYGPNSGGIDLDEKQFIITLK